MKKPTKEEELQARARALFDDSVERLDAETLSRLNQGRQRALQEAHVAGPDGQWAAKAPDQGEHLVVHTIELK
jgi:hypothetical protein